MKVICSFNTLQFSLAEWVEKIKFLLFNFHVFINKCIDLLNCIWNPVIMHSYCIWIWNPVLMYHFPFDLSYLNTCCLLATYKYDLWNLPGLKIASTNAPVSIRVHSWMSRLMCIRVTLKKPILVVMIFSPLSFSHLHGCGTEGHGFTPGDASSCHTAVWWASETSNTVRSPPLLISVLGVKGN